MLHEHFSRATELWKANGEGFPSGAGIGTTEPMQHAADLTIRLNPADDVVIARVDIPEGTTLRSENNVRVAGARARWAQDRRARSCRVHRCGATTRSSVSPRATSGPVSTSTCTTSPWAASTGTMPFAPTPGQRAPVAAPGTFQGHRAPRGAKRGTRRDTQYIGILASVNCSATVAAGSPGTSGRLNAWPNVDGVVALTHQAAAEWP